MSVVFSNNPDRHDMTEILLKVAFKHQNPKPINYNALFTLVSEQYSAFTEVLRVHKISLPPPHCIEGHGKVRGHVFVC